MNRLVLSGTGPIVPSRTRSSCYRGPESKNPLAKTATCEPRNFSNQNYYVILLTQTAIFAAVDESPIAGRPT